MLNKDQITQFAKGIVRSQKGLQNHQLMHPRREWLIGIVVALCIFSASIVWSSLKYFEYQNIEQQAVTEPEAPVTVYRKNLVDEALASFAAKQARLNALVGKNTTQIPTVVVDEEAQEGGDSAEETGATSSNPVTATSTPPATSTPVTVPEEPAPKEPLAEQTPSEPEQTPEESAPPDSSEPDEELELQPATNVF